MLQLQNSTLGTRPPNHASDRTAEAAAGQGERVGHIGKMKRKKKIAVWCAAVLAVGVIVLAQIANMEREFQKRTSCVANLHTIRLAKEIYAYDRHLTNGTVVTMMELFPGQSIDGFRCPNGGVYSVNPVGKVPSCSYTKGVLHLRYWKEDRPFGRLVVWFHRLPEGLNEY